jgi:ribulose-5-phosphate 4-epimerase/fuculose-1-phosphate aldolase
MPGESDSMGHCAFSKNLSRESFASFCRTLYDRHLATGIGGNVSARRGRRYWITPSGISMRDMTPERIVIVDSDGRVQKKAVPSSEFPMHRLIYEKRSDVNIICHVHGGYIIAASNLLDPGPDSLPPLTPGFVYFAYPLPLLPFYVPGSDTFARAVGDPFSNPALRALLLKNHGLITVGADMAEALNIAEEIHEAAEVFILTAGKGTRIDNELIPRISSIGQAQEKANVK